MQAVIEWAWLQCSNIKEYVRILNWLFLVELNCHNLENYLVTQGHWSLAKHKKGMSWIQFASCPDAKSLSNKCLWNFCLVSVFGNSLLWQAYIHANGELHSKSIWIARRIAFCDIFFNLTNALCKRKGLKWVDFPTPEEMQRICHFSDPITIHNLVDITCSTSKCNHYLTISKQILMWPFLHLPNTS
jgi:hypothetical protein